MAGIKRADNGNHSFLAPLATIAMLLTGYWLINQWHALPSLISSALATIQ